MELVKVHTPSQLGSSNKMCHKLLSLSSRSPNLCCPYRSTDLVLGGRSGSFLTYRLRKTSFELGWGFQSAVSLLASNE